MPTEAEDRLRLAQWMSPGFPVGSFAYSHGLETAIAAGQVTDAETTATWIGDALTFGAGRADAILLVAARRVEDPSELADVARALAGSAERHRETMELGRAFAETVRAMGVDLPALPYPVAVGQAARTLCLPDAEVAGQFLQAFAGALVSAAVRFVPLGQSAGQAVLAGLQPEIAGLAADAAVSSPDDIGVSAFGADVAAMQHETLEPRIFRT